MDKTSKYLDQLQHSSNKYYDGFSSYIQLNHGFDFCHQDLHWLIHQADQIREAFGKDSDEYQTRLDNLANAWSQYGHGGNFTITELQHYDTDHTKTMADVRNRQQQLSMIPFTNHQLGYNFMNVMASKGNADGDTYKDIHFTGPADKPGAVKMNGVDRPGAGIVTPKVKTPSVGGVTFLRKSLSTSIDKLNDIKKLGK